MQLQWSEYIEKVSIS
jgi:hypothetical protein